MKILLIDDVREPRYIRDIDHKDYEGQWGDVQKYIDDPTLAHEITIARTGEEGIKLLESNTYDLLLLDHDLGYNRITGTGVCRWFQENLSKLPRKVYLVTANPVGGNIMMESLQTWYKQGLLDKYDWIH